MREPSSSELVAVLSRLKLCENKTRTDLQFFHQPGPLSFLRHVVSRFQFVYCKCVKVVLIPQTIPGVDKGLKMITVRGNFSPLAASQLISSLCYNGFRPITASPLFWGFGIIFQ